MSSQFARWLCAIAMVVLAAVPARGGRPGSQPWFETQVGPVPPVETYAFHTWIETVVAEGLAACPSARSRTLHVAFGDPATNEQREGTAEDPFLARTPGEIGEVIQAVAEGGDVAVLLRRGDVFRVTPGDVRTIRVQTPNVTLGAYGRRARAPMLSGFVPIAAHPAGPGGRYPIWTRPQPLDAPMVWAVSVPRGVVVNHVHDYADGLNEVYVRCAGMSEIADPIILEADETVGGLVERRVERAFWFDETASVLYVRTPAGVRQPSPTLEMAIVPGESELQKSGIVLAAGSGGSRLEHLRVDGFGVGKPGDRNTQVYCIRVEQGPREHAVVASCEAYFSSSHVIGDIGVGGITTYVDCAAGYARNTYGTNGGHPTVFNSFSTYGDQEAIWTGCRVTHGALPEYGLRARIGRGFYIHTGSTASPLGIAIVHRCEVEDHRYGCFDPWGFKDMPPMLTTRPRPTEYRAFVVDSVFRGGNATGVGGMDQTVFVNTRWENLRHLVGSGSLGTFWLFGVTTRPWRMIAFNCDWRFNPVFREPGAPTHLCFIRSNYSGTSGSHVLDMEHCRIEIADPIGHKVGFHDPPFRDGRFLGEQVRVYNSLWIHSRAGGQPEPPHIAPNSPALSIQGVPQAGSGGLSHCAFFSDATVAAENAADGRRGVDQTASPAFLDAVPGDGPPTPGDARWRAGSEDMPYPLEYDASLGVMSSPPSIGPRQPVPTCTADFDASGAVDLNDYFGFLGAFLEGLGHPGTSSGADVDGSGGVDVNDYFTFLGAFFSLLPAGHC